MLKMVTLTTENEQNVSQKGTISKKKFHRPNIMFQGAMLNFGCVFGKKREKIVVIPSWKTKICAARKGTFESMIRLSDFPPERWHMDGYCLEGTLPETNISPENRPLETEIPIGNHPFSGEL